MTSFLKCEWLFKNLWIHHLTYDDPWCTCFDTTIGIHWKASFDWEKISKRSNFTICDPFDKIQNAFYQTKSIIIASCINHNEVHFLQLWSLPSEHALLFLEIHSNKFCKVMSQYAINHFIQVIPEIHWQGAQHTIWKWKLNPYTSLCYRVNLFYES